MAGLGFIVTLVDLLMRTSRFQDILIPSMHAPFIVMLAGSALLLLSGRLFEPLFSKLGRYFALLTFIMFLAVGVSVWPGGAYQYMMDQWIPVVPTFFFICGFVRTFKQLKATVATVACGFAIVAYIALIWGDSLGEGRAGIRGFSYGNSNDLAMVVLFGLPLSLWVIFDKRASWLIRLFLLGALFGSVPVFFRTGSRAGLLALAGVGLYSLFRLRMGTRIKIVAVAAVALPIGLAMAPAHIIDRYMTIFSSLGAPADPITDASTGEEGRKVDEATVLSAAASTDGRVELLKRSLIVTFENPFLGVGPGMFVVAENEMAVSEGRRRGYWKASHNMYTQISSEIGIAGAALFVYLIVLVWRSFGRAEKVHPKAFPFATEMRHLGFVLKVSTLVFVLCGVTLSIGYGAILLVLGGLSFSMDRLLAASAVRLESASEVESEGRGAANPLPSFGRVPAPITRG